MAAFQGDSTDDEIGVNLHLAERLSINRREHVTSGNRPLSKKDQKQFSNQRKKKLYRDDQSSSSSSIDMRNDPSTSLSAYTLHKKRQNGDKNIELLANPKRTCLSDRFGGSPERKDPKSKSTNGDVKYFSHMPNFPPQPLNLTKRSIFPDSTYEDHSYKYSDGDDSDFEPMRPAMRLKNPEDVERTRKGRRHGTSNSSVEPVKENPVPVRQSVQLIDSTSDDDSRIVRQNGALKGGRQSPDLMSFRKVLGRKWKKVIESDDTDDDWQVSYRNRRLISSSDSDDSGPSNKADKKTADASLKKSANLSFSSGNPFNSNHDHIYHKPDSGLSETYKVDCPLFPVQPVPTTSTYRGRNPINPSYNTRSSNRIEVPFMKMPFQNFDSYLPDAIGEGSLPRNSGIPHSRNIPGHQNQDPTESSQPFSESFLTALNFPSGSRCPNQSYSALCPAGDNAHIMQGRNLRPMSRDGSSMGARGATIPKVTRQRTRSSKSLKGRAMAGPPKGKSNLASRYPDLFDAEDDSSEVEFFTANSYSDTESNTESLTGLRRTNALRNPPARIQEVNIDSNNVGSSEDEIRVLYTSVHQPARSSEQRRGSSRTLGRRYSRGSRRHLTNNQDVISLSPDPVEQVRQMEEDERFARMLQAQFDAEADPTYAPSTRRSPDPSQITMEPSSSDDESIDIEVYPRPRDNPDRFLTMVDTFSYVPTVVTRRGNYRSRRPDPRNRRRYPTDDFRAIERILHHTTSSLAMANIFFDTSDDSYEAFLGIADLNGDVTRGLQRAEINRLPTRKYITPNGASSGAELPHKRAELNKECQVCLSDYVNGDVLRILPCFHEFHTPCIDPWLKINHTCPVCRVIVNLGEL